MIYSRLFSTVFFLSILFFSLTPCSIGVAGPEKEVVAAPPSPWKQENLTLEQVLEEKTKIETQLEGLASDLPKEGVEGRRRSLLSKRLELLSELVQILTQVRQLEENKKNQSKREKELTQALANEKAQKHSLPPKTPTIEEFESIKASLAQSSDEVEAIKEAFEQRSAMIQQIPQQLATAKERQQNAGEAIKKLKELEGTVQGGERRLIELQIANLRLDSQVADSLTAQWERVQEDEKIAAPLRELALELARKRFEGLEARQSLYQEALEKSQEQALKQSEELLVKKQKAVESATTPHERLLALWESEVAQLQNNIADLNQAKTNLLSHISQQEKQLDREKDDLKNLQNLVSQVGSSGPAAEILKTAFRRVSQRRLELNGVVGSTFQSQQQIYQSRRVELDSQLMGLRDEWLLAVEQPLAQLKGREKREFEARATSLLDQRRRLLREEKHLILDMVIEGQRLVLLPMERAEALSELERFVLSRVFWIQDEAPLGLPMFKQLLSEIGGQTRTNSLWNWWKQVLSIETIDGIAQILRSWTAIFYGVFLFLLLPTTFYILRKRLYGFVREQSRKGREQRLGNHGRMPILLAWIAGSLLNPVFLLLAAPLIATLDLPASLGPILSTLLIYFAVFLFGWLSSRSFFATQGVAVSLFGVSQGVARQYLLSIRLILITYLACLVPWIIFQKEPFFFEAFPRIGYLLFEIGVGLALYFMIRPGSALIKQIFSSSLLPDAGPSKSEKYWAVVSRLLALFMTAIFVMDGAGYHFGARYLAVNGLWSLVTILVLFSLNRASGLALRKWSVVRQNRVSAVRTGRDRHHYLMAYLLKIWRLFLALLGLYLVARFWGLNESALKTLTEVTLFQTTNPEGQVGFVTAADFLVSLLIVFLSFWLLRHLVGLYEAILFPFFTFDDGLRYAIVTISRYLIFLIGAVWVTSVLQVDLSKVGWVVAAMSVGLGFGLQEIVANFVSGIILLIERPIRVGDMVSIGADIYGQVTQVNIRSTTVLSRDRLEILVPNKDLISKEVINWTLSDSVIRQRVCIGVAYGSDVELVRSILLGVAEADPDVLKEPPSKALFLNHGESSLDFELRFFLNDPVIRRDVMDRLNTAINRAFAEHKIGIPFPQRDLHIISTPTPFQVKTEPEGLDQALPGKIG
ncbi:MAG: mechanosensitive ion channel [Magnetococcales bacterium]|nr:mechanosensitive ion channel [Magnetococcales bacterium]